LQKRFGDTTYVNLEWPLNLCAQMITERPLYYGIVNSMMFTNMNIAEFECSVHEHNDIVGP